MKNQGKIWLDVTTSNRWTSSFVGIVRAEAEIVNRFLEQNDVSICQWQGDAIVPVDKVTYRTHIQKILNGSAASVKIHKPNVPTVKHKLIRALKVIFGKVLVGHLEPIKAPLLQWARASWGLLKSFLGVVKNLTKKSSPSGTAADIQNAAHPFVSGDTYLTMGLDWDDKNLTSFLKNKEQMGIHYMSFCYDLIPVNHPEFLVPGYENKLNRHFVDMVWYSDHIFCISEFTQKELVHFAKAECAKEVNSSVCYLGSFQKYTAATRARTREHTPFCLSVSTIEPRKNHSLLLQVWDRLVRKHGDEAIPELIIVGKVGWQVNDMMTALRINSRLKNKVKIQENVDDAQLRDLYIESLFTLFPSFVEGWGLPIAESLSYGKVCVSSSTSSMPEVGQGLTILLSPYDNEGWFTEVEKLIFQPEYLAQKQKNVVENYKEFSWTKSADHVSHWIRKI